MPLLFVFHLPSFLFTSHKFSSNFTTEMIIFQYIQIICFISISYLSYRTFLLIFLWILFAFLLCCILDFLDPVSFLFFSSFLRKNIYKLWNFFLNPEATYLKCLHFTLTLEWWLHWILNSRLKISVCLFSSNSEGL